jgi:hypothetical protein
MKYPLQLVKTYPPLCKYLVKYEKEYYYYNRIPVVNEIEITYERVYKQTKLLSQKVMERYFVIRNSLDQIIGYSPSNFR